MAVASSPATLSGLLDKIEKRVAEDTSKSETARLSVADILDVIGRRAYGPLLLIIGVMSVSPSRCCRDRPGCLPCSPF